MLLIAFGCTFNGLFVFYLLVIFAVTKFLVLLFSKKNRWWHKWLRWVINRKNQGSRPSLKTKPQATTNLPMLGP